jgi:hypothetical protein
MYEIATPFEDRPRKTAVRNTQTGCLFYPVITYGIDGISIFHFEVKLDGVGLLSGEVEQERTPYQTRATELGVDHKKYTSREFQEKFGMGIVINSLDIAWCKLEPNQIREVKQEFLNFYNADRTLEVMGPITDTVIRKFLAFNPKQLGSSHWTTFPMDEEGRYYVWPQA